MSSSLVWISGASSGIGLAMAETVPWDGARVIGISRRAASGVEHLQADLADPSSWAAVGDSFRRELDHFDGDRVAFVHAAGMAGPIGFAGEVDTAAYTANALLNSAAPQVLGHLFLAAAREVAASRHLVMLTSGAAGSVYPGWASYGAGKAAVDQWVRNAGAEQSTRGGVQVLAVAPGTVDTATQEQLRATSEEAFPKRQKFVDLHREGKLSDPSEVATAIWELLDRGLDNGSVIDLRELIKAER
ncbi:MAG TPA: SDR family NAD(P)-dependent oxidoreductase [Pseudonocardiaceae bacterium]|jgi:NAD(P)-dependent dehydrogenase (short-subunit alcohol dehydrogenase family)|nr:SDR family NAD(P)-dependent oxidoreductase [Pseudonocardiaceae bacterium]